jgi:hypothetical protein
MSELVARQQVIEMNVFWRALHERFWVAGIIKRKIKNETLDQCHCRAVGTAVIVSGRSHALVSIRRPVESVVFLTFSYKSCAGDKMCHDSCQYIRCHVGRACSSQQWRPACCGSLWRVVSSWSIQPQKFVSANLQTISLIVCTFLMSIYVQNYTRHYRLTTFSFLTL